MKTKKDNKDAVAQSVTKISTCLPTPIWDKLVDLLKSPYSRAAQSKLDRGVFSNWILEQALHTIGNNSHHDLMEQFIEERGLKNEFEAFFKANVSQELL